MTPNIIDLPSNRSNFKIEIKETEELETLDINEELIKTELDLDNTS